MARRVTGGYPITGRVVSSLIVNTDVPLTRAAPRTWLSAASICIWIAYLVVPVEGWGLFPGRPLGLLPATALAVACWVAFARGTTNGLRIVAIALVLKVSVGATLLVPYGFAARYYANPTFSGSAERGTEPADASFTRTDHRLRFGVEQSPDVPLEFFNDLHFNYYRETEPDRNALPFSVTWQGLWRVISAGPQALYVRSPGGATQISIGDAFSARVEPGEPWTGAVTLAPGLHRVTIAWSVPQGGVRQFEAGRIVDGHEEPFDDAVIVRHRVGGLALAADSVVRTGSRALDALLGALLLWQLAGGIGIAYRRLRATFSAHDALSIAWAFGIADALVFAVPSLGRMLTLSGGNDWLTYESEARDIGLHGLWMNEGAALGHGAPFYAQPLYSYFLAACHWLFGDGLFGVYLVQRLFATITVIALWRTVAWLFDESAGLAALVTAIVVVFEKYVMWSGILLTEALFVPLVCLWIYALVRMTGVPSRQHAIAAGIVGGLATLTRSSLILGWIAVVPALAIALGRRQPPSSAGGAVGPGRLGLLAILLSTMIAVISIATVRNWVVAHRLVVISSEGPVVLYLGNPPPPLITPPAHKTQYERLGLDPLAQAVAEYVRQQPRAFVNGLWRKARFTLGWFDQMLPGSGTSTFYIVTWIAALAGIAMLRWIRPSRSVALAAIPLLVAASHFAVVVAFQPHVYGDRLIMPLYMLLVPYAAIPVIAVARVATRFGRERAAAACWMLLLLAAIVVQLDGLRDLDLVVLAVAVLVGGVSFAGLPELRGVRVAIYAAYAVALAVWLVRALAADAVPVCREEWLFLAIALVSSALLASRAARRIAGWVLLGLVAIAAALLVGHGAFLASLGALVSRSPQFADIAVCAGVGGLCAGAAALALPARAMRARRVFAYVAGGALTMAAVQWLGIGVNPERALLRGRIAAFGLIGAAAYALVWLESARPVGGDVMTRAKQGVLLGGFAASLFGAELGGAGAALLIVAGLNMGAVEADRSG